MDPPGRPCLSPPKVVTCLLVLAFLLCPAPAGAQGTTYDRTYVSPHDGTSRYYQVRLPRTADPRRPSPAVLYLHGRGGTASAFQQLSYLDEADARGYIQIFWQGRPTPESGFSTYYVDTANGVPDETDVLAALDDALRAFAIDPRRVHLAGFSQGGKGALLIGLKNPGRFASVAEGAGPSDAFEGQAWSPEFPDFAVAAGGPALGASGAVLARWFGQSPRFLLQNARNLPLLLCHGTADTNVPDSTSLFPYRNTRHIADTPGFSDERGSVPTLFERHASDPGGYVFQTRYPEGVGHEQHLVLVAKGMFDFFDAHVRPDHPDRIVARTYDTADRGYYWVGMKKLLPPDGSPSEVTATRDAAAGRISLSVAGTPSLRLDVAEAGMDTSRPFELRVTGGPLSLRISGSTTSLHIERDGRTLLAGSDYVVGSAGVDLGQIDSGGSGTGTTGGTVIALSPEPDGPIAESDLLVPVLVDSPGPSGAHLRSELVLANTSEESLSIEALLVSSGLPHVNLELPARSTRAFPSSALLPLLGVGSGAFPLRLRVIRGVAGSSSVSPRTRAFLLSGTPDRPSRLDVSFFAPFEDVSGNAVIVDQNGLRVRSIPLSLRALERIQLGDVLGDVPAPARLAVELLSGRAQVYGTVVSSSATSDAFRSPVLQPTGTTFEWTVPTVASARDRSGAVFSTDLYLNDGSEQFEGYPISVAVTYRPRNGGSPRTTSVTMIPGTIRVVFDVVRTLFPEEVPGAGALEVRSFASIEVLAVTRSNARTGPSGQDVSCVPAGREITASSPAAFVGVAEDGRAHSNLVLVNRGPATTVTITLLAEDGPRGTLGISLAEGEVRHLDLFSRMFSSIDTAAATLLVTPFSGGSIVASVSHVDNLTNDPTGLTPVPLLR